MPKVELSTETGAHVKNVEILPYLTPPAVLLWGNRVFKHLAGRRYRECFAVVVPIMADAPTVAITPAAVSQEDKAWIASLVQLLNEIKGATSAQWAELLDRIRTPRPDPNEHSSWDDDDGR